MKKMLCDLKNELITKYKYSDDLAENIALIAESVIDDYGEYYENVILDAIMSCEFKIKEPNERNIASFRNREGYYSSVPVLSKDGDNIIVNAQKEIILPNTFNSDNPAYVGVLTSRILELVSSSLNEFSISGNELVQRQGLMTTTYSISDNLELTKTKEIGRGLNEGINSYETLNLMRSEYDTSFEPMGSDYTRIIAGSLIDGVELKELLTDALMTKDTGELENIIVEHTGKSLNEFLSMIDGLTNLEMKMSSTIGDRKEVLDSIEQEYNSIAPLISSLSAGLVLGSDENVPRKVA